MKRPADRQALKSESIRGGLASQETSSTARNPPALKLSLGDVSPMLRRYHSVQHNRNGIGMDDDLAPVNVANVLLGGRGSGPSENDDQNQQ